MENASSFSIFYALRVSNIIKEFLFALHLSFAFLSDRFGTL
jgi:hypothetical protein